MSSLKYLIEKEFKQILRNPIIPKMIMGYPVLVLLIFPWAINFEVKNIKVDVVDESKSVYSQRLIDKINSSAYFILHDVPNSYEAAFRHIEKDEANIILEIPSSFDRDLVREQGASVRISANAVNSTEGLLGTNYLTRIVNDFSQEIRHELAPEMALSHPPRVEVVPDFRYNKGLDFKLFMLPAFIALIITLICGILPSLNIVLEKETGTIQQINTTPVSKFNFILAKLIPFWIIGVIMTTISFLLVWIIYGMLPIGSFVTLYLAAFVFIIGVSGFGIIVSNYSDTLQQSMFLVMFFILIIILLSGVFTPVSGMPIWAQVIAFVNPLTHFSEILRLVYLKGSSLLSVAKPMLILVVFAIILNTWAVVSYKKNG